MKRCNPQSTSATIANALPGRCTPKPSPESHPLLGRGHPPHINKRMTRRMLVGACAFLFGALAFMGAVIGWNIRADSELSTLQGVILFCGLGGIAAGLFVMMSTMHYFEESGR